MIKDFQKITEVEKVRHTSIHFTVLTFCLISAAVYVYLYSNLTFKTAILSTVIQNAFNDLEALNNKLKAQHMHKPYPLVSQNNSGFSTDNTSLPLLVIFTTFSDKRENYLVRNNTLQNWISFGALVKTVFFSENVDLVKRVKAKGWDTMAPSKTSIRIPILKYMYLDVMKKYPSKFYAYANGDLLFTYNLVDTLLSILKSADVNQTNPILIVGQRTNVNRVTAESASTHRNIEITAKKTGKLFTPWGEDYFITSSNYPWNDCPEIVIGRIAYDNWLVLNANKHRHTTIDATKTLLAVHQTTKAGNAEGHHQKDKNFNGNLLGKLYKRIDYGAGLTTCTRKYTVYAKQATKEIQIKARRGC